MGGWDSLPERHALKYRGDNRNLSQITNQQEVEAVSLPTPGPHLEGCVSLAGLEPGTLGFARPLICHYAARGVPR